ncbi:response regulator [Desulforhopalus sp. 52FAK]
MDKDDKHDLKDPKKSAGSILVVDDNTANIDVMLTFLEMEGYDISIATSGKMALHVASHDQPELILLDVMMPNMDGFETCRKLKDDPATATIPIIFVTAKKETADIVQGFKAGGVDYISKPYRQEEVISRVRTHLQLRRLMENQERLIDELNQALKEVKTLKGILPICSYCKKIRDEEGHWHQMEKYIATRSDSEFSHGVCEECYAEIDEKWKK